MTWSRIASVNVTEGSKIVTVSSGTTLAINQGDALSLAGFDLAEIEGVFAEQLLLAKPWASASLSDVPAVIVPTFGNFNDAVREIRMLREATVNNYSEMERFWTEPGEVTFKSYNAQEFTFKTAKQTITDLAAVESQMSEAAESAISLVNQYSAQLGDAYQRVLAARDEADQFSRQSSLSAQTATEKAQQTSEDVLTTQQNAQQTAEDRDAVSSDRLATAQNAQTAQNAATVATEKAQQTSEDVLTTQQNAQQTVEDREAVLSDRLATAQNTQAAQDAATVATEKAHQTSEDVLTTQQNAQQTAEDREAVSSDRLATAQNAQTAQDAATVATEKAQQTTSDAQFTKEQADKAAQLVESATGGSLLKEANLSDLASTAEALENLGAYSQQQVDDRLANKIDAIALEISANTFVYDNGRLMQQSIEHGDGRETITYTYTNNVLTQAVSVRNGVTKTITYTYTDGRLVSIGVATE
ncbi:hypothetical protein [Vibrio cholerae]